MTYFLDFLVLEILTFKDANYGVGVHLIIVKYEKKCTSVSVALLCATAQFLQLKNFDSQC